MSVSDRVQQFMNGCLVSWVRTFDDLDSVENIEDLADGVIFCKIMHAIDPNTYGMSRVQRSVCGNHTMRLQNLQLAVNCLKHFYLTTQQQFILVPLPDVTLIAHEPNSDLALDELDKMIILLLGCAVQSDNKAMLIQKMKEMPVEQQQALIPYIKKVNDTTEFVCHLDWTELGEISKPDLEALLKTAYIHLQRVGKERDNLFNNLVETTQEKDFYKEQQQNSHPDPGLSPISPQINPELLELKKHTRVLQEQLDRKAEAIAELEREVELMKQALQQSQQEKMELIEDAKSVRAYRDEVETLKVQSAKVERLEADITRYRQKAEDAEYLKKRVVDLKQQNELMAETKTLLEQKAITLNSRAELVDDLQVEVASLKVQLDALNQEKKMDIERIEELVAQNARLELENKSNQEQIDQLSSDLENEREKFSTANMASSSEASLGFEMTEADLAQRAKLVRLEKETREMEKNMEALRHSQAKVAELEKTNKKLYTQSHTDRKGIIKLKEEVEVLKVKASRVDKLQAELSSQREKLEEANRMAVKVKELKQRNESLLESKATLEDEMENLQSKVALLDDHKTEIAQLKAQVDSFSSEHMEDQTRIKELLEQNAQLELEKQRSDERENALRAQLDHERSRGGASPSKLTVITPPRVTESDMAAKAKLQRLERQTKELEKQVETYRHSHAKVTELEKTNKKLYDQTHADRKEIIRLKEEMQSYKSRTNKLERQNSLIQSHSGKIEDAHTAKRKMTELRQQNALLSENKTLLEEEMASLNAKLETLGELQADNAGLKVRVSALEQEKDDEELRMQELMQQNAQLELQRERLIAELDQFKSELQKVRSSVPGTPTEVPASPVSMVMSESELATKAKLLHLERDYRDLQRSMDLFRQRTERAASELEKTNQKLNSQIHSTRKENFRFKEELKHVKEQNRKLTEQLSGRTAAPSSGNKQIHNLETKFDEAYSQSMAVKEERISQLEQRLEETTHENYTLRNDVTSLRKELIQSQARRPSPGHRHAQSPREISRLKEQAQEADRLREEKAHLVAEISDTRHIMQQQQHRIETELEKSETINQLNQTLEEEKKMLLLQVNKLLEQNQGLLMRSLENKDTALEDERVFSDRLDKLEKDKARLSEQLISQQREAMAREMDMLRKREKSKSLLKRGIKKLKGKIQSRSHRFPDAGIVESGPGPGMAMSPHSTLPATFPRKDGSGSLSSIQSISSGNSLHSDSHDEERPGSTGDLSKGLIPRAPTFDANTPVTLRQRKTRSLALPSNTKVTSLAQIYGSPKTFAAHGSDVLTLEEILAEAEKNPNRRKVMELKRASQIIATPPATPRNSMMFGLNQVHSYDQINLERYLQQFQSADDTTSIAEEAEDMEETSPRTSHFNSHSSSGTAIQDEEAFDITINSNFNNNNCSNNSDNGHPSLTLVSRRSFQPQLDSMSNITVSDEQLSQLSLNPSMMASRGSTPEGKVEYRPAVHLSFSLSQDSEDVMEKYVGMRYRLKGNELENGRMRTSKSFQVAGPRKKIRLGKYRNSSSLADLTVEDKFDRGKASQWEGSKQYKSTDDLDRNPLQKVTEEEEAEEAPRGRAQTIHGPTPTTKTKKKSKSKRFSLQLWRKNSHPVLVDAPFPSISEQHPPTSTESQPLSVTPKPIIIEPAASLSQNKPLVPPPPPPPHSDPSFWNNYGYV